MQETIDIVICGAGIAGIATAYYLAKDQGITDVIVIDHAPLSQTTAKSGENYRNWWPYPPLVDFTNRSIDLMEGLAAETANHFQMHHNGYLYVSMCEDVESLIAQLEQTYSSSAAGLLRSHHGVTNSTLYDPLLDDHYVDKPTGADILTDQTTIRRWFPISRPRSPLQCMCDGPGR
ncbi:MAG: FAD-dependent oxidoreductase [Caldilineaceae bacterium]